MDITLGNVKVTIGATGALGGEMMIVFPATGVQLRHEVELSEQNAVSVSVINRVTLSPTPITLFPVRSDCG